MQNISLIFLSSVTGEGVAFSPQLGQQTYTAVGAFLVALLLVATVVSYIASLS